MKMTIEEIWSYYKKDLILAEEKIKETFNTIVPAISEIGEHILKGGGKRIRPFLAILSSRLLGYSGDRVSILACCVESIHTASLLHDDIVDGANIRRGQPSAHSLWGNQVVVLVGDYLYSNALRLINSLQNYKIMDAFSMATAKMSEGELLQLHKKEQSKKGDFRISEEDYIKIITGKTAVLMSAACRSGAVLADATQKEEDALSDFGLKLGMAFQITDDNLDYMADEKALGKGLGKDLEEGKITLPIIYLLNDALPAEVERVKAIISDENFSGEALSYILDLMNKYSSIKKSYEKARIFVKEARKELDVFGDSTEKSALLTVSDYTLTREK